MIYIAKIGGKYRALDGVSSLFRLLGVHNYLFTEHQINKPQIYR